MCTWSHHHPSHIVRASFTFNPPTLLPLSPSFLLLLSSYSSPTCFLNTFNIICIPNPNTFYSCIISINTPIQILLCQWNCLGAIGVKYPIIENIHTMVSASVSTIYKGTNHNILCNIYHLHCFMFCQCIINLR